MPARAGNLAIDWTPATAGMPVTEGQHKRVLYACMSTIQSDATVVTVPLTIRTKLMFLSGAQQSVVLMFDLTVAPVVGI
jgi:hypothetical protein